jgi:cytochrome b subunit of formate dehydrogenase
MKIFFIFIKSEFYRLIFFIVYLSFFVSGLAGYNKSVSLISIIASCLLAATVMLFPFFIIYCFVPLYQKFEEIVFFKVY